MTINDYDFNGKRALIRVDFNVPLNDRFEVSDDNRIRASLPTAKKILAAGGSVVFMSHLGRPKSGPESKYSLKHIVPKLAELMNTEVQFAGDCIGEKAFAQSENLKAGEVLLLENLRFYPEETAGDEAFAKQLARHGDVYVNDAFGTAHRAHASTAIIAQYMPERCFGLLMQDELDNLNRFVRNPKSPVTAIVGGAKVSSKIGVIQSLLPKIDLLIIGGGMTYTFAKAKGGEVGNSLVEEDKTEMALELLREAEAQNVKVYLPTDSVIADDFNNEANRDVCATDDIPAGWMGLDIGERTIAEFREVIHGSASILWNGPMGVFEMSNFSEGTKAVAEAIAEATDRGAYSLVGGGDSVAAINKFDLAHRVSYVSTGGGAMLEYLEGKVLPGVAAME
jgi:phosphoglycerate kinase